MGFFDLISRLRRQKEATEFEKRSAQLSHPEPAKLEQLSQKLFAQLRSLNVQEALNSASIMFSTNHGDASCAFLEGALSYAMRSDGLALSRFRTCMKLEPLFAEVPYYVGQILTESAIEDYEKAFSGPLTAEKALRWAKTYDEAVTAFAWAERTSNALSLMSIPQHLRTYNLLLGVDRFSGVAPIRSEISAIDDRYISPDKWLSLIGFQHNEQQVDRREALADLVSNLVVEKSVVFVIGENNILSPMSFLLSRRKRPSIFEVGPTMPDEMLKARLSSIKAGSVVLTDSRRIGFGGYFPWTPLGAEVLDVVFVNPQHLLSVELLGLLARVSLDASKLPTVRFTLAKFKPV